ncbi:hypothetical protein [Sphingomonas sp. BK235]|uniref:hypothetical protein n=1 Tax=Sphingomonas sp. BK235 TaxID=2512131 RepID=UPI001042BAB8|nr:hypothetical protein [Sphingomonas sp. BK235]TCP30725.1 hypothetical protein EV292_11282 [Sphingomonas sp. BK235]
MREALAFGQPVELLVDVMRRHNTDLEAGEALALGALARDERLDPAIYLAVLRWRAVRALMAACGNDSQAFQTTLLEAARLNRVGVL